MHAAPATREATFAFGRYETLFRIGAGGMAEVFAARLRGEAGFERLVAIKRLLPHLADDPAHVARFLDEARLAARVVHPHVVQTLDLDRSDEGEPFLVLELILGTSLDRVLALPHPPPLPVLVTWLIQAAEGLHAAHGARAPGGEPLGLVHRDVSPHNVLIGADGDARIGDFGVAQSALLKMSHTPAGSTLGKLAYLAPEQALSRPLDARADVFALGVVAWEAVTGARLFHADHPAQVIDRVRTLEIPPPHRLVPAVPARLSAAVMAALARDPEARTPSARAFAAALDGALAELGGRPSQRERARQVGPAEHPGFHALREVTQDASRGTRSGTGGAQTAVRRRGGRVAALGALTSLMALLALHTPPGAPRTAGAAPPPALALHAPRAAAQPTLGAVPEAAVPGAAALQEGAREAEAPAAPPVRGTRQARPPRTATHRTARRQREPAPIPPAALEQRIMPWGGRS